MSNALPWFGADVNCHTSGVLVTISVLQPISQSEARSRDVLNRKDVRAKPFNWRNIDLSLPYMTPLVRFTCRSLIRVYGDQVIGLKNAEPISRREGPFILALNHSQKREAIFVPALIGALRQGRQIHFMADWNFLMIPIVAFVIRCNRPIIVDRKSARPRFLNVFKPFLTSKLSVMDQARRFLSEGEPIGIFTEGTVNRDPKRLMRGLHGAAQLSLEQDVPVIPCGIRFPLHPDDKPVDEKAKLELHFGTTLQPAPNPSTDRKNDIRSWHQTIMMSIAELSGKDWSPTNSRRKYVE